MRPAIWAAALLALAVLLLGGAPTVALARPGDRPLRPRFETPSEKKAREERPRFQRPSEHEEASEAPANASSSNPPRASASRELHRIPFHVPSFFSETSGYWHSFSGEEFLARPREVPTELQTMQEARKSDRLGVFYARGFYSYLTGGFDEWSGTELMAYFDIADGFSGAATWHHEFRGETGSLGVASLSARLAPDYHLISTISAGNGADFLPRTSLDLELRAPIRRLPFLANEPLYLHYAVGAGTSSWSGNTRRVDFSVAAIAWVPTAVSAELRLTGFTLDSPESRVRLNFRSSTTLRTGTHGVRLFQLRFDLSDAPEYQPGIPVAERQPNHLTADLSWGLRSWVKRHYGYILNLTLGGQLDTYARFGADLTVFLEF